MFVKAPVLFANGSVTSTKRTYRLQAASSTATAYPTIAEAFAHAGEGAATYNSRDGDTTKSLRQNGVIGFRQYKNTPYRASYRSYQQSGEIQAVVRRTANNFCPEIVQCVLGPDTAAYSVQAIDQLADLDPKGSRSTATAVLNRALLLNLTNRANAELRVKSMRKTWDVAASFAEIDETALMVAERTIQVLRAWRALRKGNVTLAAQLIKIKYAAKRALKDRNLLDRLPEIWLEMQYGWLPLLNDIFNGYQTLAKGLSSQTDPVTFSVVRRLKTELYVGQTSLSGTRFNSYGQSSTAWGSIEMRYRLKVSDPNLALIQSLGLMNPLTVLWERLPASFIIDWFVPVGTLLQAVTAPVGLQFASGYCTTVTYGEQAIWSESMKSISGYSLQAQRGRSTSVAKAGYMARDVLTTWPGLLPYFTLPFSSPVRMANAAALAISSRSLR